MKNQLARALADYDNLRKRVETDKNNFEKLANLRLVLKLLPVLDVLKKAQEHVKDPGIAVTIKEFEEAIKTEGIEEIKVKAGDGFNPELMEVIEAVVGKAVNTVAEIVQTGYKIIDGPVIRHTKVKVWQK
ncbi:MAG: nucleotide exchange factor GrpE [Patescibacteria group bacterium]